MSYELALTNLEVRLMFGNMVRGWFLDYAEDDYTDFIQALLNDDRKQMNIYMNRVLLATISYFDSGSHPSRQEPERFYHGLVLGLLVELYGRYVVTSNRESGYGRYDVMLEPQMTLSSWSSRCMTRGKSGRWRTRLRQRLSRLRRSVTRRR